MNAFAVKYAGGLSKRGQAKAGEGQHRGKWIGGTCRKAARYGRAHPFRAAMSILPLKGAGERGSKDSMHSRLMGIPAWSSTFARVVSKSVLDKTLLPCSRNPRIHYAKL